MAFAYNSIPYKLIALCGKGLITTVEFFIKLVTADNAFMPINDYSWVSDIEERYPLIKSELMAVMAGYDNIPELKHLSAEQERIVQGNKWRSFFLYAYGLPIERNCKECPETTAALKTIPGMQTAFFSILEPNTRLTEHRGLYKGVLRYHLALVVPQNERGCAIKVNGEERHWQAGKSLIFDDSYLHSAWNNTDEKRIVLFVDFERPLPFPISAINKGVIWLMGKSPFIQNILEKA